MTQAPSVKSYFVPVLIWLGAFICALFPVNAWQLEFFMLGSTLIFAWTILMLFRQIDTGWELPRSNILRLAGAFWLLVLASAFWSEAKPVSLMAICLFSFFPLTFYGGVMGGGDTYFAKLVKPLALIFTVLSLWAVFQFFFLNAYFSGQARHPLADPSSLGALFMLVLFVALGWMVSDRPTTERRIALALAILLVCGICSTVARAPFFAFVPGFILFALLLWPQVKASARYFLILLAAICGYYALMQLGGFNYDIGWRLLRTIAAPGESDMHGRILVWQSTIDMIKQRPLLGTGYGTYFLYYPEFRSPLEPAGVLTAHNDPLQYWAELGVLGPLLFFAFIVTCVWRSFAALRKLPKGSADRVVIVTILAALTALVASSQVGFSLYNLSILMLGGLLLSVWFQTTRRALAEEDTVLISMPAAMPYNLNKALIVLPFIMMGWLVFSIAAGEKFANNARDALFAQDMNAFMNYVNKADHVSMRLNARAFLFAVNVPMAILEDRKSTLLEDQQKKLYDQVNWYMEDVLSLNPRTASAYYYLAKVQSFVDPSVVPDGTPTPEEYYNKALELDPEHLGARFELLKMYDEQGRSKEEQIALLEPIALYRFGSDRALEYYGALAKLYLETGNYEKSKEVLARMAEFKKRSDFSLARQNLSIPQAVMAGEEWHGQ